MIWRVYSNVMLIVWNGSFFANTRGWAFTMRSTASRRRRRRRKKTKKKRRKKKKKKKGSRNGESAWSESKIPTDLPASQFWSILVLVNKAPKHHPLPSPPQPGKKKSEQSTLLLLLLLHWWHFFENWKEQIPSPALFLPGPQKKGELLPFLCGYNLFALPTYTLCSVLDKRCDHEIWIRTYCEYCCI